MKENKLPEELQKILDQNGYNQTSHLIMSRTLPNTLESHLNLEDIPTIEVKVYSFDVLGNKLYVTTQLDHLPYIKEYIDSINNGNPNKEGVIRKYAIEHQKISESLLDRIINQMGNGAQSFQSLPIGIIGELNKIESYLKPLLDAQKRDKKIDDLLDE